MDKKNFGKNWSLFRNAEQAEQILEWGCPEWFSDFINESVEAEFTAFNYQDILGWTKKSYVKPRPELLGHHLSNYPSDLDEHLKPSKLISGICVSILQSHYLSVKNGSHWCRS
jgi:hypothetical protein